MDLEYSLQVWNETDDNRIQIDHPIATYHIRASAIPRLGEIVSVAAPAGDESAQDRYPVRVYRVFEVEHYLLADRASTLDMGVVQVRAYETRKSSERFIGH
jgi:hypothetical protein